MLFIRYAESKNINILRPINSNLPAKIKTYNSPRPSISKLPMLIASIIDVK